MNLILCPICKKNYTTFNKDAIQDVCVHSNQENAWQVYIKDGEIFSESVYSHKLKIQICYTGMNLYYTDWRPPWFIPTKPGTYIYQNTNRPFFKTDDIHYLDFKNMDELLDKIKHFIIFS